MARSSNPKVYYDATLSLEDADDIVVRVVVFGEVPRLQVGRDIGNGRVKNITLTLDVIQSDEYNAALKVLQKVTKEFEATRRSRNRLHDEEEAKATKAQPATDVIAALETRQEATENVLAQILARLDAMAEPAKPAKQTRRSTKA